MKWIVIVMAFVLYCHCDSAISGSLQDSCPPEERQVAEPLQGICEQTYIYLGRGVVQFCENKQKKQDGSFRGIWGKPVKNCSSCQRPLTLQEDGLLPCTYVFLPKDGETQSEATQRCLEVCGFY